jgi:hypothetical protein
VGKQEADPASEEVRIAKAGTDGPDRRLPMVKRHW